MSVATEHQDDSFKAVVERDPLGNPFLDILERRLFIFGAATCLVSLVAMNLELTVGWAVGWLTFQLNIAVLRRLLGALFAGGAGSKLALLALVLKMGVLMVLIWMALKYLPADPMGFFGGFTTTLTGLVIGSVVWAPRQKRDGTLDEPGASDDNVRPLGTSDEESTGA